MNINYHGKVYRVTTEDQVYVLCWWVALCEAWRAA